MPDCHKPGEELLFNQRGMPDYGCSDICRVVLFLFFVQRFFLRCIHGVFFVLFFWCFFIFFFFWFFFFSFSFGGFFLFLLGGFSSSMHTVLVMLCFETKQERNNSSSPMPVHKKSGANVADCMTGTMTW